MNTLQLDTELNALIVQGKTREAFLEYYDEAVVAQENDEPERTGREQWMLSREEFGKNVEKYEARILANAANGDVSFSEWAYDLVIRGVGPISRVQVAVRHWRHGRVVRERFYHK